MNEFYDKGFEVGRVFTPGSPVDQKDLFAGRVDQLRQILNAMSQRGYHAVLYGERGVGKTSLANTLISIISPQGGLVAKVNCDVGDDFNSIWRKAFRDISFPRPKQGIGFTSDVQTTFQNLTELIPDLMQPDDIRRVLTDLSVHHQVLIVLDEYDRISDPATSTLIADTIKSLSDFGVNASILLIGVAESIDDLIVGHMSIERALVQIPMPRMTAEEIRQIVERGLARLEMSASESAVAHLITLSQGLPYIAHLLALHSTRAALDRHSFELTRSDMDNGIATSIDQWQSSITSAYYKATKSQQPGNIYKEVLLACALAEVDELGYFTAASLRSPLSKIAGRTLDIPNFARHLKEFSEDTRGGIIVRVGTARRLRYRFVSPLMRPYIIMRGYRDGLLSS